MKESLVHQDEECRIQIGEFCCGLRFNADTDYIKSVKYYFENFLSEQEPDIIVDIEIILHQEYVAVPSSLYHSKSVDGNNFNFHSGLITGTLDLANKKCSIQVKNALLSNPATRIFEQFLLQLYYTLLENKYGTIVPGHLLVHSCGVLKNGCGYMYVGPSGSGKSTVAQLSTMYDILNDEISLIKQEGDGYTIYATPFNGYFRSKKNMSGPLKKIFFLKQDGRHYIKRIKLADAIILFTHEIVPPMSLLSTKKTQLLSTMLDYAAQLLTEVPFFELHFLPDKNFWVCIEELEVIKV